MFGWLKKKEPAKVEEPKDWCVMYRGLGVVWWANLTHGCLKGKKNATPMTLKEAQGIVDSYEANGDFYAAVVKL